MSDQLEYRVGRFSLTPFRQLMDADAPVSIGHKALALLSVLARADGSLVTKDELMSAVWPSAIVEDNALQVHVAALRRALGPDAELLRTVHGLGYRLTVTPAPEAAALPLPDRPSIAIMPFADLSADGGQDYFADGMVEEIVTVLARFKSIFVIGSGSTLAFRGTAVSPQEVGRRFGVRYVLDGSIRRHQGRVRIAVKLSDAASGAQVFAERFEDRLEDVFALQDKVALSVAGQIEPTIQVAETRRASARPIASLGCYELYLRAWALERTFVKANVLQAHELVMRAIELDPTFAPALALAAICHRVIFNFRWSDDPERVRREGIDLARRALRTGADDATVLANVASALIFLARDPWESVELIDRAFALNPGSATVWFYSGVLRLQIGHTAVGLQHLETALRLDPAGPARPNLMGFMGQGHFQERRFAEAIPCLMQLVQETDSPRGYAFLAATLGQLGRLEDAAEALAGYRELTSQPIDDYGSMFLKDPAHFRLFLEGVERAGAVLGASPDRPVTLFGTPISRRRRPAGPVGGRG